MTDFLGALLEEREAAGGTRTAAEIAQRLNDRGVTTATGLQWSVDRVRKTLQQHKRPLGQRPLPPPETIIDLKVLEELIEQGMEPPAIAAYFGVHPDSIRRAKRSLPGYVPPKSRSYTDDEIARAKQLLDDGVLATWVADDLARPYAQLIRRFRPGVPPEWLSVWQSIRQNDELLRLHREFAPKRSVKARGARPLALEGVGT